MSERLFENLRPAGITFAAGRLGSEVSDQKDAARILSSLRNGDNSLDTDDDTLEEFPKEGYNTDDDTLDEFPEETISQPNSASPLEEDLPFGDDCGHNLGDCVVAVDSFSTRASMPANFEPTVLAEAPDGEQTEKERNAKKFSGLCAGLGEGGSSKGLYQVTDKDFIPKSSHAVPVKNPGIRDGEVVEVLLMYGDKAVYDSSARNPNIGFRRGFEAKVKDGCVEFPFLAFATKKRIMQCAIGNNGKLSRKGKRGFDSTKIPTDPRMNFPFWIKLRTKETRIEIDMPEQWRFQIVTTLDHVDDEEYLQWRREQTEAHNTAEKAKRAKMAKSDKSEKRPSSSLQQATKERPKKRAKVRSGSSLDREVSSSGPGAQDRKFAKFDFLVDVQLIHGGWSDISGTPWMHYGTNATQSDKDLIGELNLYSKLRSS